MEVRAQLRYLRLSPTKVRLVTRLISGLNTGDALAQLSVSAKGAARPVRKLVQSAVANAKNNFQLVEDRLFVKKIFVDQGPTLKRFMPRAHGRATPIRKRTCHVTVILDQKDEKAGDEQKKATVHSKKIKHHESRNKNVKVAKGETKSISS